MVAVHAVEGVVGRQDGIGVAARDLDRAGVAGGHVAPGIQRLQVEDLGQADADGGIDQELELRCQAGLDLQIRLAVMPLAVSVIVMVWVPAV